MIPAGSVQHEPAMTIDLLPTIVQLTGATLPAHKIDGLDIWPLITMEKGAKSPHEAYFMYYNRNELHSILSGEWKLYLPHSYRTLKPDQDFKDDGIPNKYEMVKVEEPELYNLRKDISEKENLAASNPQIVEKMMELAENARADMGDALIDREGANLREPGRIMN